MQEKYSAGGCRASQNNVHHRRATQPEGLPPASTAAAQVKVAQNADAVFGFRRAVALKHAPLTDSVVDITDFIVDITDFTVDMTATHVHMTNSHVYMTDFTVDTN
jgi:hypothetical protein